MNPSLAIWSAVIAANVLLSAAVGYGVYRWTESGRSDALVAEDMAGDPETMDEKELPEAGDETGTEGAAGSANAVGTPVSACDGLAADPEDPNRAQEDGVPLPGTAGRDLPIAQVLAACPAVPIDPKASVAQLRTSYQHARALMQSGRFDPAVDAYVALCNAQYGIACFRLAQLARAGAANVTQDDFVAMEYAQLAATLNVAAAGDLMQELGPLVNPATRLQARAIVEPLLRGQLDAIPDTESTRRYVYTLFMQSEKQNAQWYVGLMSNQDHLHARQTIWPVLQERLKLTGEEAKKIYERFGKDTPAQDGWRTLFDTAVRGVMEMRTFVQNVNSVQLAVGAQDAQQLFEWFSACQNCSARQAYVRQMSALLQRWATRTPQPDDDRICKLLFRDGRPDCRPLGDYEGGDGGRATDIFGRTGTGPR